MPFEISPKFVPAETKPERAQVAWRGGDKFQLYADALLRGCETTSPAFHVFYSKTVCLRPRACALGAMVIGLGRDPKEGFDYPDIEGIDRAYHRAYGATIAGDNDNRRFTREQIAARIAAL